MITVCAPPGRGPLDRFAHHLKVHLATLAVVRMYRVDLSRTLRSGAARFYPTLVGRAPILRNRPLIPRTAPRYRRTGPYGHPSRGVDSPRPSAGAANATSRTPSQHRSDSMLEREGVLRKSSAPRSWEK